MKAVFIGGGALRHLAILRTAMGTPGLFDKGQIILCDLNLPRAKAMAAVAAQTPEARQCGCKITATDQFTPAIDGADVVSVVLMGGNRLTHEQGNDLSVRAGFLGSDNLSLNGAFLAMKTAPFLMQLARQMERRCPEAWLLNFANPVGPLSAMVNAHTRVKALGVCAGYTNHRWDLSRILSGQDHGEADVQVRVAGVNHLSFIVEGTYRSEDLFVLLKKKLKPDWQPMKLLGHAPVRQRQMRYGLEKMAEAFRSLGVVIFSTEPDGLGHLFHDEAITAAKAALKIPAAKRAEANKRNAQDADERFADWANQTLDEAFWKQPPDPLFAPQESIFTELLAGIGGVRPAAVVASHLNRGAVAGLPDKLSLEYSMIVHKRTMRPETGLFIPPTVFGLTASLAQHQTLLADAMATQDPHVLAQALLCYPVGAYSQNLQKLVKALMKLQQAELPLALRKATNWMR